MEADQVSHAISGILKTSASEIAIIRRDIIQDHVLDRGGNHGTLSNLVIRQQEQLRVAKEVGYVVKAELTLNSDVSRTKVGISVKDVAEANHLGDTPVHLLPLIPDSTLSHCEGFLERAIGSFQRAGVDEGVKPPGHILLKLEQELLISQVDSIVVAVLVDSLNGYTLCELLHVDRLVVLGLYDSLGVRDLLALTNGAVLQCDLSILRLEHSAGSLSDNTGNSHDIPQVIPVVGKSGYKINFAGRCLHVCRYGQITFSSHFSYPPL